MKTVYLDYASTTKIRQEVVEEMLPYLLNEYGNPSSLYEKGIKNRKVINKCRSKIASIFNANKDEIYFCSGGSEANNWAIKGIAFSNKGKLEIITTKIEHHSILKSCEFLAKLGYKIHYLNVNEKGFVNIYELEETINQNTALVSVMMANNEIGTIQNIKKISEICKKQNVLFHTDAIQAAPHLPIDVNDLGIDLMSISSHKFYGPKGIGALYIRSGVKIENLIHGGHQEKGKRAGTENVAYIVGMTKAIELSINEMNERLIVEKDLISLLYKTIIEEIKDVRFNGPEIGGKRLPNNLSLSFKDVDGSILSFELNKLGICVSTGSACNSDSIEPSHVLQAINVPQEFINGTIRISLGKDTTIEDIKSVAESLINLLK